MNKDLTVGKPALVLTKFCLPLFGSIIFQQLYNIADSFVAGKFIGEEALAAVGNSYEITLIFLAIAFGCNIGCSVITSQLFGAKNYSDMKTAVYTTLISTGIICILLMVFGFIFSSKLLVLINTPENIFEDSKLYLDIYILGILFVFFYNVSTGIFTALGDSKTPFIFLACSSTANIAMDIVFVTVFKMGISGVAWATFICQGISCVLAVFFVLKRISGIKTDKASLFSFEILKKISVIAIPSMLQHSFISVGNIIIQSVVNSFGSGVIAGYSAAIKLNNLVMTSFSTIGNGISNYSAQNLGAGKIERVKQGLGAGVKILCCLCVPLVLLYFFFGKYLVAFFINNPTNDALSSGTQFLKIVSPFYFIISIKLIADGILRGIGIMWKFLITTFSDLILRVVLSIILSGFFESTGIWLSWPVGWCIATALSVVMFKTIKWNKYEKGLVQNAQTTQSR